MAQTQTIDWTPTLVEQADWHWQHQLRARFEGLTDEEYLWEPSPQLVLPVPVGLLDEGRGPVDRPGLCHESMLAPI